MTPAHRRLREATAAAHDRVDALFGTADLRRPDDYLAMLSAHAEALFAIEAALNAGGAAAWIEDWPDRRRSEAIEADLADLGRVVDRNEVPPAIVSDAAIAGTLYVLEGSRMGGRVLARALPPEAPRRYLATPQSRTMWLTLLERIDGLSGDDIALNAAVDAALDAFARFEQAGARWLAKVA